MAYAPDGKTLVSVGEFASGAIWDMVSKQRTGILLGSAVCLSFSADGKRLATVTADSDDFAIYPNYNKLQIWDVAKTKKILEIAVPDATQIFSVSFSPDGRKLFYPRLAPRSTKPEGGASLGYGYRQAGQVVVRLAKGGLPGNPYAPDGKTALLGLENGDICVHDQESGAKRFFRGQVKEWRSLQLSPDASSVLVSGTDGPGATVRLWEVLTG